MVSVKTETQNEEKVVPIPLRLVAGLILGPEQLLVYECFCLLQNVGDFLELALTETPVDVFSGKDRKNRNSGKLKMYIW